VRSTPLVAIVRRTLRGLGAPGAGQTVVTGLSGGADSVALLDVLATLGAAGGFRVVAAHLDHGLRPDSGADAAFCAALCDRLGVPLRSAAADVRRRAAAERGGLEEAGRRERYAFLRAVAAGEGAAAVAVAHTRDDQAETVLLRLLRGAGSLGLGAMRPRSGDLIRPLLAASRRQVLAHLDSRGLAWREDATNADPAFLRNRVRHELIPYLESRFNPRIREALARSAELLADESEQLEASGRALLERTARAEGAGLVLPRAALQGSPRAVARAALRQALDRVGGRRAVAAAHVERILELAAGAAPSGRRLPLPGGREAVFSFDELRLGPGAPAAGPFAVPLDVPGRVELPGGLQLTARTTTGPAVSHGETAVVAVPEGPLVVRTRQPGDRVRSRGREMSLRRFFMDRRIPVDLRRRLPLLASGRQVLWIPGQGVEGKGPRFVRLELQALDARGTCP